MITTRSQTISLALFSHRAFPLGKVAVAAAARGLDSFPFKTTFGKFDEILKNIFRSWSFPLVVALFVHRCHLFPTSTSFLSKCMAAISREQSVAAQTFRISQYYGDVRRKRKLLPASVPAAPLDRCN